MSSVDCAEKSSVANRSNDLADAWVGSGFRARNLFRPLAVVMAAAWLAGCAQSSMVSSTSDLASPSREPALQRSRTASLVPGRQVAAANQHTPFARRDREPTKLASRGIASFYTDDQETASGEKFNTNELTAAHPTLPFGTRLRVTNVSTGRSVTVRVNDRGPYVPGRVVDVSHSAADALGMLRSGVAEVKLDVVQ
jgi:rare lipoprotein A